MSTIKQNLLEIVKLSSHIILLIRLSCSSSLVLLLHHQQLLQNVSSICSGGGGSTHRRLLTTTLKMYLRLACLMAIHWVPKLLGMLKISWLRVLIVKLIVHADKLTIRRVNSLVR